MPDPARLIFARGPVTLTCESQLFEGMRSLCFVLRTSDEIEEIEEQVDVAAETGAYWARHLRGVCRRLARTAGPMFQLLSTEAVHVGNMHLGHVIKVRTPTGIIGRSVPRSVTEDGGWATLQLVRRDGLWGSVGLVKQTFASSRKFAELGYPEESMGTLAINFDSLPSAVAAP